MIAEWNAVATGSSAFWYTQRFSERPPSPDARSAAIGEK